MARTAIVTGGTRGIGAAISKALLESGMRVTAIYGSNDEAAAKFKDETGIAVHKWDVADFDACAAGVKAVEAAQGGTDVLVNNAGITRDTMIHKMDKSAWDAVIGCNLTSAFNMCRAVIDGMRERRYGRIVNVSSINGQKGQLGQTNYSAAKAGLLGFTRALAQETARRGITVNAVAPGYIETDMVAAVPEEARKAILETVPVGRFGAADEIARAVAFLADEKAGFITGSTLTANGGQYIAA